MHACCVCGLTDDAVKARVRAPGANMFCCSTTPCPCAPTVDEALQAIHRGAKICLFDNSKVYQLAKALGLELLPNERMHELTLRARLLLHATQVATDDSQTACKAWPHEGDDRRFITFLSAQGVRQQPHEDTASFLARSRGTLTSLQTRLKTQQLLHAGAQYPRPLCFEPGCLSHGLEGLL